jgi:hypothetical protein
MGGHLRRRAFPAVKRLFEALAALKTRGKMQMHIHYDLGTSNSLQKLCFKIQQNWGDSIEYFVKF